MQEVCDVLPNASYSSEIMEGLNVYNNALFIGGSITLIPCFVAFLLAAALLKSGAGFMQIAVFISTLMMVGIVTIPPRNKIFR
ncbi:MAG TPA: hypothetical protein VIO64_15335 [Pseudobacteroides sp.]|uniref:hypothetical protein n=1 Tax=Pseudobacteroides sp. TaxID=1968840 RepID=UPI002F927296